MFFIVGNTELKTVCGARDVEAAFLRPVHETEFKGATFKTARGYLLGNYDILPKNSSNMLLRR